MTIALRRDERSAPFFDGTARGELLIHRTPDARYFGPEKDFDPMNPTGGFAWVAAAGTGTLISWIIARARPDDAGNQAIAGITGVVELDEGPWLYAPLVDVSPEAITAGMTLKVIFPHVEDGETAPAFTAA